MDELHPGERGPAESAFHHRVLAAMEEPELPCIEGSIEAYRLVQTLALDPMDVTIGAFRRRDGLRIRTVVRHRGDNRVVLRREDKLTEAEWDLVRKVLDDTHFWTEPTSPVSPPNSAVLDGGTWAFEGYASQRYHVVLRHTHERPLKSVAQLFLDLAKLDVEGVR